jgi:hypothetical protein
MTRKKDALVFFKKIYAHKHHEIKLFNTVTMRKKLLDYLDSIGNPIF